MWVRELVKAIAGHVLPNRLLQHVRRRHYYRVLAKGSVDEPELAVLGLFVKPGAGAIDAGANFGLYTKALAELVGPTGRVYSIEPIPETFDVLTSSVARLGLRNVVPMRYAVSDSDGVRVRLVVPNVGRFGLENPYRAHIVHGPARGRQVIAETCTLDSLVIGQARRFAFVKCDVEGHELFCLRGAVDLIRRSRPTWLIEVSGDPRKSGSSAGSVFDFMGEFGYRAYVVDRNALRPWRLDQAPRVNYFFVPNGLELG